MNPVLVGVAFAVTAGALIAVSAREARVSLVGLAVLLMAAPFLADPLPSIPTLALRLVGGALAAYILRAAVSAADREGNHPDPVSGRTEGSRVGWPTEALWAGAAWVAGLSISIHLKALGSGAPVVTPGDLLSTLQGDSLATAAGLAVIVLGIVPALGSRDPFRTTAGIVVLVLGAALFRSGAVGAPTDLEQMAGVALTVAAAVTGSILINLTTTRAADADHERDHMIEAVPGQVQDAAHDRTEQG